MASLATKTPTVQSGPSKLFHLGTVGPIREADRLTMKTVATINFKGGVGKTELLPGNRTVT